MKTDLVQILNTLGDRINRWYPDINAGGCCVYASLVGEELRKRGIKTRIIVANDVPRGNIDKIRQTIKNINSKSDWNDKDVYFQHVGVEFVYNNETFHYDSNGVNGKGKHLGEWKIYPGRFSVDEAKALADEAKGWCSSFNRRKIPSLKRHVQKYLATNLSK